MAELRVHITTDRLEELVTVEELILAEEGKMAAMVNLISKFCQEEEGGGYMDQEKAQALLIKLKVGEMKKVHSDFMKQIRDTAVP